MGGDDGDGDGVQDAIGGSGGYCNADRENVCESAKLRECTSEGKLESRELYKDLHSHDMPVSL